VQEEEASVEPVLDEPVLDEPVEPEAVQETLHDGEGSAEEVEHKE
jgi:hypothetical protein